MEKSKGFFKKCWVSCKNFIKKCWNNIKNLFRKAKNLYKTDKRAFCMIATRFSFGFLFWIAIMLPQFGDSISSANVFSIKLRWIWFFLFLVVPMLFLVVSLKDKKKLANIVFQINTILTILMCLFLLLAYVGFVNVKFKFGLLVVIIITIIMCLLAWKEDIIMNPIYKIFNAPEIEEVEYVREEKIDIEPEEKVENQEEENTEKDIEIKDEEKKRD